LKTFQEGYRKLIEAGKMPNDSKSSILGNASERYKLEEAGLKQTGGNYDSNCKTIYEILVRAYA
jgi:hypothetical protein